jgi:iron complex transport system permease protein
VKRIPASLAILLLLAAAAGAVTLSLFVGPTPLGHERIGTIVRDIRLPRAVLAFVVGAALGASGVTFQGLFRNPLADPFVVGVSGGAALGAVATIVAGVRLTVLGLGAATAAAFAGGAGAAFLAYELARVRGRTSVESMLLSGSAIGAFAGALVSILLLFNTRNWNEVISWLMGNLGHPDPWSRVQVAAPFALAALAVMALYARDLDLLLLGEESARQLGVEAERVKLVLLGAGAVAAAAAVAVAGIIGFVGLVVPHVVRRLVGPGHRTLLPVAVLAGGLFLTLADIVSRALSPETPLPVGAVTALAGAPFFVYVLRRRLRRG